MAALGAQSIASSYEQLLHVDADGGGNGTTHVSLKDGDNGTTFPLTLATDAVMVTSTNRLEFGDNASYIHQSADGVLDLVSDTEIELTATTIDINGAVDMSSTLTAGGDVTLYKTEGTGAESDYYIYHKADHSGGTNESTSYIKFHQDGASARKGQIEFGTGDNGAPSAKMTLDENGNITLVGDLILANTKGISFAATADAGTTTPSELLDDYEEGTWTGVVTDGTNPTTMDGSFTTGYYTKVGNIVTVSGLFKSTSLGSASGNMKISGFPFTIANNNAAYSGSALSYGAGLNITAGHTIGAYTIINTTTAWLSVWDATGGISLMQEDEWTADGECVISFTYRAA